MKDELERKKQKAEYDKKYNAEHKEAQRLKSQIYYIKNREDILNNTNEYNQTHKKQTEFFSAMSETLRLLIS